MGTYSKLIASVIGSLVAALLAYLATKGLGTCAVGPDGTQACSVLGFSSAQITGTIVTLISAAFVYFAPKNTPPS